MVKSAESNALSWTPAQAACVRPGSGATGYSPHAVRVPSEWVSNTDGQGNLRLAVTRAVLDGYLGRESHTGLGVGLRDVPPARGS
jgi:hypothetical protein